MKQSRPVIGLTGGIGSGKSMVSGILKKRGGFIVDADAIAHQATEVDTACYKEIVACFGPDILDSAKRIRRKDLGQIVFADPGKLKMLEDAVHKYVKQEMKRQMDEALFLEYPFIVLDVPLLIGSGLESWCREIWLVYAPIETRVQRVQRRDNMAEEAVLQRIQSQMSWETMKQYGHVIIDNGAAKEHTQKQVEQYLAVFLEGEFYD